MDNSPRPPSEPSSEPSSLASFVCQSCKLRKKACDKKLPSCSRCRSRNLICNYIPPTSQDSVSNGDSATHKILQGTATCIGSPSNLSTTAYEPRSPPTTSNVFATLRLSHNVDHDVRFQVYQILQSTGQLADDLTARFFHGPHLWLPFISRDSFHRKLLRFPSDSPADFSLLLLCICLLVRPQREWQATGLDEASIYLTAKMLFVQLQSLTEASIDTVKAGVLLATLEYARQRSTVGLATLSMTIRLAYSIGLDQKCPKDPSLGTPQYDDTPEAQERNNVWWAIVICERILVCETKTITQPLTTFYPQPERPLPSEISLAASWHLPRSPDSLPPITSFVNIDGIGRAAQAGSLLSRVIESIRTNYNPLGLAELRRIDADLQSFLSVVLEQCRGTWGVYCGAIAIALRAMFLLHHHLLSEKVSGSAAVGQIQTSSAALDAATNIMIDIAQTHAESVNSRNVDALPPTCIFTLYAALEHVGRKHGNLDTSHHTAQNALESFLGLFIDRWRGA